MHIFILVIIIIIIELKFLKQLKTAFKLMLIYEGAVKDRFENITRPSFLFINVYYQQYWVIPYQFYMDLVRL